MIYLHVYHVQKSAWKFFQQKYSILVNIYSIIPNTLQGQFNLLCLSLFHILLCSTQLFHTVAQYSTPTFPHHLQSCHFTCIPVLPHKTMTCIIAETLLQRCIYLTLSVSRGFCSLSDSPAAGIMSVFYNLCNSAERNPITVKCLVECTRLHPTLIAP